VAACAAALQNCCGKVILIAGGRDKGSDFSAIEKLVSEKVKAIIVIGEARVKIRNAFSKITPVYEAGSMLKAVKLSIEKSMPDDIILLSPMCASFDMYSSYSERGRAFKQAVRESTIKNANRKITDKVFKA
jgi:UDP-N-acetylmuramoylalanine--D-glutamate ligase